MKIETAIKLLQPDTSAYEIAEIKYKHGFQCEEKAIQKLDEAIATACEALEKQIPKRLEKTDEFYQCPVCGENIAILPDDNYCFNCGQALDWSDEK